MFFASMHFPMMKGDHHNLPKSVIFRRTLTQHLVVPQTHKTITCAWTSYSWEETSGLAEITLTFIIWKKLKCFPLCIGYTLWESVKIWNENELYCIWYINRLKNNSEQFSDPIIQCLRNLREFTQVPTYYETSCNTSLWDNTTTLPLVKIKFSSHPVEQRSAEFLFQVNHSKHVLICSCCYCQI